MGFDQIYIWDRWVIHEMVRVMKYNHRQHLTLSINLSFIIIIIITIIIIIITIIILIITNHYHNSSYQVTTHHHHSSLSSSSVHLVVFGDVSIECSHEDHRYHEGEEEDDEDGVDDREPMHLEIV